MANGFLEPITLQPQPQGHWVYTVFMVAAALTAIAVTALALSTKALVAAAVLVVVIGRRIRLSGCGTEVRVALVGADGQWHIGTTPGTWIDARLVRCWGATLGPVMAFEWIDGTGRPRHAYLLKAGVSAQVWRRLRVRLRLT